MTKPLPRLHPQRDGLKETVLLVNQLRDNLPSPACLMIPVGPFNLLATGQTLAVPANVTGFASTFIDIVPSQITGSQTTEPVISIGSNATFDDIVETFPLGTSLVAKQVVALRLAAPIIASTLDVYIDVQTAATGPTLFTAMVYLGGYYL